MRSYFEVVVVVVVVVVVLVLLPAVVVRSAYALRAVLAGAR